MAKSSKVRCTELENRVLTIENWMTSQRTLVEELSQSLVTSDQILARDKRIELLESRLTQYETLFKGESALGDPAAEADEGPFNLFVERVRRIEALEAQLTKRLSTLEGRSPNRVGDFQGSIEDLLEKADLKEIAEALRVTSSRVNDL